MVLIFNMAMENAKLMYNYMFALTPNMPLIQLWCAQSKLNMDEICILNIHL